MSEPSAFGFGQFVPGFDFLQNLSKNAAQAQPAAAGMPGMGSWVAPTLNIEDIDKRIQEMKSVLFWLEQNTAALKATIQAMEVQKMTLTTLQGMNVNMADLAKAFTAKPPVAEPATPPAYAPSPAESAADQPSAKPSLFTPKAAVPTAAVPTAVAPEPAGSVETASAPHAPTDAAAQGPQETAKPAVDPMQWWGALTQQFQGIAAAAMKDVAGEALKASKSAKAVKPPTDRRSGVSKTKTAQAAAAKPAKVRAAAPSPASLKAAAQVPAKVRAKASVKAPGKTSTKTGTKTGTKTALTAATKAPGKAVNAHAAHSATHAPQTDRAAVKPAAPARKTSQK